MAQRLFAVMIGGACLASFVTPTWGGAHTWDVNEVFSNADGSVWFIELREANGTDFETNVGGRPVTSTTNMFTIASNVAAPTGFKTLLFANQAFADLPGAPAPDQIVPIDNFFSVDGDTITYSPYDSLTFGSGQLPTNGIDSLNRDLTTGTNSPTNYAGETGTVDASGGPSLPGVPDGSAESTPMTVTKLDAAGSSLSVAWDVTTCSGGSDHNIIFGVGSQLPSTPGGIYALSGGVCAIGNVSPFVWDPAPSATDGTGLLWWLIVTTDRAGTEGSWGKRNAVDQRQGPGPNGSSEQCGVSDKDLSNTCGQ